MTRKKGIAAVLALCIAVMLISYYIPISVTAEYPVMQLARGSWEGPVEVRLELTVHRRLIRKHKIDGEIEIDGTSYEVSNHQIRTFRSSYGWGPLSPTVWIEGARRWREEKLGRVYEARWREPVGGEPIIFVTVTKDFAFIRGFLPSEDPPYSFAGPASSREEVEELIRNNP